MGCRWASITIHGELVLWQTYFIRFCQALSDWGAVTSGALWKDERSEELPGAYLIVLLSFLCVCMCVCVYVCMGVWVCVLPYSIVLLYDANAAQINPHCLLTYLSLILYPIPCLHQAGLGMLRQLYFGAMDIELHSPNYDPFGEKSIFELQHEMADKYAVIPPLADDRFLCSFGHIFAGGYSAGYYSYKWAGRLIATTLYFKYFDVIFLR